MARGASLWTAAACSKHYPQVGEVGSPTGSRRARVAQASSLWGHRASCRVFRPLANHQTRAHDPAGGTPAVPRGWKPVLLGVAATSLGLKSARRLVGNAESLLPLWWGTQPPRASRIRRCMHFSRRVAGPGRLRMFLPLRPRPQPEVHASANARSARGCEAESGSRLPQSKASRHSRAALLWPIR